METNNYVRLKDAAQSWGISVRRVQMLCASGRIAGAVRMGRDWMIPADSDRPVDARTKAGRLEPTPPQNTMPRKTPFLYMTDLYDAPGCAEKAIEGLSELEEARAIFAAELACARGEIDEVFERASYLLRRHTDFYSVLAVGTLLAQCAIWKGDLMLWRKAKIHISEANARDDREREILTFCLCCVDSMLYDVKDFPEWFRIGCFELLHQDTFPAARVYYAQYIYAIGHALAAKTVELQNVQGLALMGLLPATIEPMISWAMADKSVISEIYLRLKAIDPDAWKKVNSLFQTYVVNWSKLNSGITGRVPVCM